jgi:hypothetical protein
MSVAVGKDHQSSLSAGQSRLEYKARNGNLPSMVVTMESLSLRCLMIQEEWQSDIPHARHIRCVDFQVF